MDLPLQRCWQFPFVHIQNRIVLVHQVLQVQVLWHELRVALREAASRIEGKYLHLEDPSTPIFEIIGYFEREIRKYIKKNLEMELDVNWLKKISNSLAREKIEGRISEEKEKIEDFKSPENPLDYVTLETLSDLITRRDNWTTYFSKCFENKNVFSVKMREIIVVQNRIAHYRSINFNDAVIVIQNILWMLDHLRKKDIK